ncbi:outer membrane protein assembly factor BamB family protein [Saccharibacillus alkalitolerans]|nr:PQQ-binding-like beta-propeller repeat protein [Saccharibacillus alkalitolerans]
MKKPASIRKPQSASIPNKRDSRQPKPGTVRAGRLGIALCLPLILLPASALPAYGAAPAQPQQAAAASTAEQSAAALQAAPYFKSVPEADDRASLGVIYYEKSHAPLTVIGRRGELLETRTPFDERAYVPVWYTESRAAEAEESDPLILRMKPGARLHLFPESELSWPAEYASSGAISAIRYGDWYGISLPAEPGYEGGSVVRPALLWVESDQVLSTQAPVSGLLSADSTVPTDMVRSLTETFLTEGATADEVLKLLGEPFSRTPLSHFERTWEGDSNERGVLWRYERGDAQMTLSFDPGGRLTGWNWIQPTADAAQTGINSSQPPYVLKYEFRTLPPVPSVSPKPAWQAQDDLDAQYLLAASEDALLIRSDDSFISGGHMESGIYALDRASGQRLWERETGSGTADALFGQDGRSVLLLTGSASEQDGVPKLRSIRLSDGTVRWSREVDGKEEYASPVLNAAGTSVMLSLQPGEGEKGKLTVLSQRSGEVRWTKEFADPYTVLNKGSDDPYVLIQQGRWIQALDPRTGKAAWSLKADRDAPASSRSASYAPGAERADPFAARNGLRWLTLGGDWVRMNTSTGEISGRYPIRANEQVDRLGDGNLLIRRASDAAAYEKGAMFQTVFYDAKAGKEVWSLPGRAEHALPGKDRLYVLLNGIPAALSLEDGQPLWQAETSEFALGGLNGSVPAGSFVEMDKYVLLPYGPDLLVFDARSGKLLHRIDGFTVTYNEINDLWVRNGLLNADGKTLYLGSANGQFTAVDGSELNRALDAEPDFFAH